MTRFDDKINTRHACAVSCDSMHWKLYLLCSEFGCHNIAISVSFRIFMKGGQKYVNSNFGGGGHAIGAQSAL